MDDDKQKDATNLPPIKDARGNILKVGDKVKILISEFNYPAEIESIITIGTDSDDNLSWVAQRQGIGSILNAKRAKNYEKID